MKDSCTYGDMPEDLPAFVTVCQLRYNQIRQWKAEKSAHSKCGVGSGSSPKVPTPRKAPETAPAGMVAGYTGQAAMDPRAHRRRILDEE